MNDREIIKIMGWAHRDDRSDAKPLRRARDLVEAARREREAEIRAITWLDGREAFEREMIRLGYDATALGHDDQTNDAGVYFWPEVQAMWRGWELMRSRAAALWLFGGREAA